MSIREAVNPCRFPSSSLTDLQVDECGNVQLCGGVSSGGSWFRVLAGSLGVRENRELLLSLADKRIIHSSSTSISLSETRANA